MIITDCHSQFGYYPISFSYPKKATLHKKKNLVSIIKPGTPYSFSSEDEYLAEYKNSYYGETFKKAGWDCFRHIEIMASGSIPLMADIRQVPKYTMALYPKNLMREAFINFHKNNEAPSEEVQKSFIEYFNQNLTSQAMVRYIFNMAKVNPNKVLFIDQSLPQTEDYLSILTLIGLKQVLGKNCFELFHTPYIYNSYIGETSTLYGRGFGYAKKIDMSEKSITSNLNGIDLIVLGSLARNLHLVEELEKTNIPLVYLYGEDLSPKMRNEEGIIHNSRATTFVREIY